MTEQSDQRKLTQAKLMAELISHFGTDKQTALGKHLGLYQSQVSRLLLGDKVGRGIANSICKAMDWPKSKVYGALGIPLKPTDEIEENDAEKQTASEQRVEEDTPLMAILREFGSVLRRPRRPDLGTIPAGLPEEREAIFREAREAPWDYELTVIGDSMEPIFHEGDILIVRPSQEATVGKYVVATVDGENVLKQLAAKKENGETIYSLKPANGKYQEICAGRIIIQGVVIGKIVGI